MKIKLTQNIYNASSDHMMTIVYDLTGVFRHNKNYYDNSLKNAKKIVAEYLRIHTSDVMCMVHYVANTPSVPGLILPNNGHCQIEQKHINN